MKAIVSFYKQGTAAGCVKCVTSRTTGCAYRETCGDGSHVAVRLQTDPVGSGANATVRGCLNYMSSGGF